MSTRAGLFGLIGLTLGISACTPVHVTTAIDIDRPVESAWRVFSDADHLGDWMHATWDRNKMHWADADADHVGAPRVVRLGEDGKEMELIQTITSIEPQREFRYTFEHSWADTDFAFYFEPTAPDSCIVRCEFTAHPNGVHGIWMHLARGSIEDRFNTHLNALKDLVEVTR